VRYPDQDGDGIGSPQRHILCVGATTLSGFAVGGYEDDDISRSRLPNDRRGLFIRLLFLGWKACETSACAPGGEPHGSAVHGSCSPDIARKSLSPLASRARQCGRPLA
jgi:hypothetical protein